MKQNTHDEAKRDAFSANPEFPHAANTRRSGSLGFLPFLLSGVAIGGLAAYFFDPERGLRRRAELKQQSLHLQKLSFRWGSRFFRDRGNRSRGLLHLGKIGRAHPNDRVLHERIRSSIGRKVRSSRAVKVRVQAGHVTLSGRVLGPEVDDLLSCVSSVRGVKTIRSELKIQDDSGRGAGASGQVTAYLH